MLNTPHDAIPGDMVKPSRWWAPGEVAGLTATSVVIEE